MRKIYLISLLSVHMLIGWAQDTYTLSPDHQLIDRIYKDAIDAAAKQKAADSKLTPLMKFANRNIAIDDSFASFDGNNSASSLFSGGKTWHIDKRTYRLPTVNEMVLIAPFFPSSIEMPRFTKSNKVNNNRETLKLEDLPETTVYSDYASKDNVIYGLRFKKRADNEAADNPYRSAYRYTIVGNMLTINVKYIGADAHVKKVKDIDDPNWWAAQSDIQVLTLPINEEGVAYCTNEEAYLLIDKETIRMSNESNTNNYRTRPYIDIEKSYEINSTLMHFNISGKNIKVDKTMDPTIVEQLGKESPLIDVYVCSNPATSTLEYKDGMFPYGKITRQDLGYNSANFHITLTKNFSSEKRCMVFFIKNAEHLAALEGKFTIIQEPIALNNLPDSVAPDYIADNYLNQYGAWSNNTDADIGKFEWDDAMNYANISTENDENGTTTFYHLPSLRNLSCVLPSTNKSFVESYEVEEVDSIAYGIYCKTPRPIMSSYYSSGDGTIYAIRPVNNWGSVAYRYRYNPQEGLVVDYIPMGSAAYSVKGASEISDGEIFSRSGVRSIVFNSTGCISQFAQPGGALWTSTENPCDLDEAMAYEYDKTGIYIRSLPKSSMISVIPFQGEEKMPEAQMEKTQVPTDQADSTPAPKPRKATRERRPYRQRRTTRRPTTPSHAPRTPSRSSNHIIVVDKTK